MAMEEDERLLASLVLLLRLPLGHNSDDPAYGEIIGGGGGGDTSGSSALKDALERNDCELLCFVGRLVHNYFATSAAAGGERSLSLSVGYAYLRLAVHISFLRYASPYSLSLSEVDEGVDDNKCSNDNDGSQQQDVMKEDKQTKKERVCDYERCLLASLLAAICARDSIDSIEEIDVELAWVVQGLLVKLSTHSNKQSESLSGAWSEAIDALVTHRQLERKGGESPPRPKKEASLKLESDEQMMIQTLHTILDRDSSSETNQGDDWNLQYNISLVSCIQSYLQTNSDGIQTASGKKNKDCVPLWTHRTLFEMIHWSQQNQALSTDIYRHILQYLHLCIHDTCRDDQSPQQQRQLSQLFSSCVAQAPKDNKEKDTIDGAGEFANAMRSFLFYGLVVLGNAESASPKATEMADLANTQQTHHMTDGKSSNTIRGETYMLVLELLRLLGPNWLYMPQSTTPTSTSDLWWFQSGAMKGDEQRLGLTWPLCTLISLAAGEFRLGLGRWISLVENGKDSANECTGLSYEIHCCSRMVIEAVQLMTAIAEDEDTVAMWSPDAILHIRKSLEDALNSSVQYFNSLSMDAYFGQTIVKDNMIEQSGSHPLFSEEREEIGRSCCLVMGTIASELDVDHLLAISSAEIQNSGESKEFGHSSFPSALRSGIIFCDSLGEKQLLNFDNGSFVLLRKRPYEYYESLTHLLPCILNLVSNVASDREENDMSALEQLHLALACLSENKCLLHAISRFLYRASIHWSNSVGVTEELSQEDSPVIQGLHTIISMVNMCTLIINELIVIVSSSSHKCPALTSGLKEAHHELSQSLDTWRGNLKSIHEGPNQSMRSNVLQTLDLLSDCSSMLDKQINM